jgi:hypothetical protein
MTAEMIEGTTVEMIGGIDGMADVTISVTAATISFPATRASAPLATIGIATVHRIAMIDTRTTRDAARSLVIHSINCRKRGGLREQSSSFTLVILTQPDSENIFGCIFYRSCAMGTTVS